MKGYRGFPLYGHLGDAAVVKLNSMTCSLIIMTGDGSRTRVINKRLGTVGMPMSMTRGGGGGAGTPTHWQCAAPLHCRSFPRSLPAH